MVEEPKKGEPKSKNAEVLPHCCVHEKKRTCMGNFKQLQKSRLWFCSILIMVTTLNN